MAHREGGIEITNLELVGGIAVVVLAVAFGWAWVYASGETARRNRAIYRDKYPDYKGGDHL